MVLYWYNVCIEIWWLNCFKCEIINIVFNELLLSLKKLLLILILFCFNIFLNILINVCLILLEGLLYILLDCCIGDGFGKCVVFILLFVVNGI